MNDTLKEIQLPISEELKFFEKHFKASMKSHIPLLDKITYYIVKRKGKQVRPMFVFLAAKTFGEPNESSYIAASLIELLHTATLVHDDVVDDSYQRRGFFSINALWKNKIAVLVGDFLLSRGMLLALDNEEFRLLKIMSKAVKDMSEGELLQIEKARKLDIKESIYFDIIRQKSASLIGSACSAGVASVVQDEHMVEQSRLFGEKIGIAFQIKDDIFDYGVQDIGKPLAIDIQEKKMTLPLIYALERVNWTTKRKMINTVKRHNKDKVRVNELIKIVKDQGGIEYATQQMEKYKNESLEILQSFPKNEYRDALEKLVHYVVDREY